MFDTLVVLTQLFTDIPQASNEQYHPMAAVIDAPIFPETAGTLIVANVEKSAGVQGDFLDHTLVESTFLGDHAFRQSSTPEVGLDSRSSAVNDGLAFSGRQFITQVIEDQFQACHR